MKRLSIALLLLLSGFAVQAQEFRLGFKGGVNFVDIDPDNFDGGSAYQTIQSEDEGLGYHAGAFVRADFALLLLQTELNFTHLDQTLTAGNGDPQQAEDFEVSFNRFDIPLLAGINLGPFHAMAGPVASLNIEGSNDIFDRSMEELTWGYQLGAGIDIGKITLGAKYEGPFSDTANRMTIGGQSYQTDTRVSQFIVSLALNLL